MGARRGLKREGMYVYIELVHLVPQQRPTQHYKAITLQLKKFLKGPSFLDGSSNLFILLAEVLSLCFIHCHHHVSIRAY